MRNVAEWHIEHVGLVVFLYQTNKTTTTTKQKAHFTHKAQSNTTAATLPYCYIHYSYIYIHTYIIRTAHRTLDILFIFWNALAMGMGLGIGLPKPTWIQMAKWFFLWLVFQDLHISCLSNNTKATFVIHKVPARSFQKEIDKSIMCAQSSKRNSDVMNDESVQSPTLNTQSTSTTRRNSDTKAVFELISNRCGISGGLDSQEWKKARRYIYHATSLTGTKNPLSTHQIKSVLDFLDETFDEKDLGYTASGVVIDASFIIQSVPRILRKDTESYLKPTVGFLKRLYGPMFYEFVKRRPDVLLTSGVGFNGKKIEMPQPHEHENAPPQREEDDITNEPTTIPVDEYLATQDLGLSTTQIAKMKMTHPAVFRHSLSKIQGTIEYLLSTFTFSNIKGGEETTIGKMIRGNPNILNLSVSNLKPKVSFLNECGFDSSQEIVMLCKKYPGILCLSLDGNLRPTVNILQDLMASVVDTTKRKEALYKSLSLHPQLLALSPKNIAKKAAYFDSLVKLDKTDAIAPTNRPLIPKASLAARIAISAPSVYSLSLDNIRHKILYLSSLWGGEDENKANRRNQPRFNVVAKHVFEYPNILTLSLEGNIQPTISFYNRTGYIYVGGNTGDDTGADGADGKRKLVSLPPRYIATSLYNRLLPRWNYHLVHDAEIIKDDDNVDLSRSVRDERKNDLPFTTEPPLHILAGATDEMFCKSMKYDYETYMKFKKEAIPRLKFSGQFDTWLKTGLPIDDLDIDSTNNII